MLFVKAVEECMKMKMRQHRGCGLDVTGQGVGGGTTTAWCAGFSRKPRRNTKFICEECTP